MISLIGLEATQNDFLTAHPLFEGTLEAPDTSPHCKGRMPGTMVNPLIGLASHY